MATGFDLENFLEMLAAERGATENTLAGYRRDLEDFSQGPKILRAGKGSP